MADLNKILDELVVFKNGLTGEFFSNSPLWANDTIREAWAARNAGDIEEDSSGVDDDEDEEVDYNTWTNEDLRAELSTRELDVTGKKAELIARLEADDAAAVEGE